MPFLAEMLDSIASQEIKRHSIIVWDNGSTDGTLELLRSWIPGRIPGIIVEGHPLSLPESRAELVLRASTNLCCWIDADDVNEPRRTLVQTEQMNANPALVAVGCVPMVIDEAGARLDDWHYPIGDAAIRWRTNWQVSLNQSSVMFKRDAVIKAGNYRAIDKAEDLDLWIRLAKIGAMMNIPEQLFRYRRHPASTTASTEDFYQDDLIAASRNSESLFPGMPADAAIDLWKAAYPHQSHYRILTSHIRELEKVAALMARQAGLNEEDFTTTDYFKLQLHHMRRNMMYTQLRVPDGARNFARAVRRHFKR